MFASKLHNLNRLSICTLTHLTSSRGFARKTANNIYIDFESLRKYKDIHGHLLIPVLYSFEKDSTDVGPHYNNLGKHAQYIRNIAKHEPHRISPDNQKKLLEMDFIWDLLDERFRRTILAVVHYKKLYGNTFIPVNYVVPQDDESWPLSLRGEKLGDKLRNLVALDIPPKKLEFIRKLGIDAATLQLLDQRAVVIIEALSIYKKVYNKREDKPFLVPRDFIVPSTEPWPQHTWGLTLGMRVHGIRHKGYYSEYHEEFRSVGLNLNVQKYKKRNESIENIEDMQDKAAPSLQQPHHNNGNTVDDGNNVILKKEQEKNVKSKL